MDVGGTFTDLLILDETSAAIRVAKVPSTPADQSVGLLAGLEAGAVPLAQLGTLVHGTTVGTNAVLERKGARVGLITTRGFRDVLEMRRRDRRQTWGLAGDYEPLAAREDRVEVPERTLADGQVLEPVDTAAVAAAARTLAAQGCEALAIAFLNSYASADNERAALAAAAAVWPNRHLSVSHEVLPEIREFERTSTTVVNAYVQPKIDHYLALLEERLARGGYRGRVLIIQSNGGVMSTDVARKYAVNTVLSGPAAGVIAATEIAGAAGFPNVITGDMGGTSFDVSLIAGGRPTTTMEAKIDFGITIRVPMIEINTIGAGGGSVAWIEHGILQVGPESAGADPGPACYGKGGTQATVTDANLVLGRIPAANPIGRREGLDVQAARAAIARSVATPLGLSVEAAAAAIIEVANHKMAGAIRLVSVERGHDPREFVLVPFGGAGPLHAGAICREVGIKAALVPVYPGITSALGCVMADVRHDFLRSVNRRLLDLPAAQVRDQLSEFIAQGEALLRDEGIQVVAVERFYQADMAYEGQPHTIRVDLPRPDVTQAEMLAAFTAAYQKEYNTVLHGIPVRLVSLRASVVGRRPKLDLKSLAPAAARGSSLADALAGHRPVFFGSGWVDCPIYVRERLPLGARLGGPAIVQQADATTVVEPDMAIRVDDFGNLLLEVMG